VKKNKREDTKPVKPTWTALEDSPVIPEEKKGATET
jgi:hypothetical protein